MPDTRSRRGPHPKDRELFSDRWLETLRTAVDDLSWLLGRGYSDKASLKLVGDRYALRDRQRKALQRCAASGAALLSRQQKRISRTELVRQELLIDGYNVLLTLEAALSGGLLLLARDGVMRDLAAMSGHYRRVDTTRQAVGLLERFLSATDIGAVTWYLDRPVSNSGRLKALIEEVVAHSSPAWQVRLTDGTDRLLIEADQVVASADSAVIDGCSRWYNLAREVVETSIPQAWILDLEHSSGTPSLQGPSHPAGRSAGSSRRRP